MGAERKGRLWWELRRLECQQNADSERHSPETFREEPKLRLGALLGTILVENLLRFACVLKLCGRLNLKVIF